MSSWDLDGDKTAKNGVTWFDDYINEEIYGNMKKWLVRMEDTKHLQSGIGTATQ